MKDYSKYRDYFDHGIARKMFLLEKAKEGNVARGELLKQKNEMDSIYADSIVYLDKLQLLKNAVINESNQYRTRRLEYLNNLITESLSKVFPEKGYVADVSCDFNRRDTVTLELKNSLGRYIDPEMQEGMLLQYLISFSAMSGIAKGLGSKILYIDEAFGASSMENLPKVGELLSELVNNGIQIILVSQNPLLYDEIPRKEFFLEYDADNLVSNLIKTDEFNLEKGVCDD